MFITGCSRPDIQRICVGCIFHTPIAHQNRVSKCEPTALAAGIEVGDYHEAKSHPIEYSL